MKTFKLVLAGLLSLVLTACACMQDIDGAYASKEVQKTVKELAARMDPLKFQVAPRYTYRILEDNAREIEPLSLDLARRAPDSYCRKLARDLSRQAPVLAEAARLRDERTTTVVLEGMLKDWAVLEQYKKP